MQKYTSYTQNTRKREAKKESPSSHNSIIFSSAREAVEAAKQRGVGIPDRDVEGVIELLLGGTLCNFLGGMIAPVADDKGDRVYAVFSQNFGGEA